MRYQYQFVWLILCDSSLVTGPEYSSLTGPLSTVAEGVLHTIRQWSHKCVWVVAVEQSSVASKCKQWTCYCWVGCSGGNACGRWLGLIAT